MVHDTPFGPESPAPAPVRLQTGPPGGAPRCYLPAMDERAPFPQPSRPDEPAPAGHAAPEPTEADPALPEASPEPRLLDPRVRVLWWVDGMVNALFLGGVGLAADLFLRPRLLDGLSFGWITGGVYLFFLVLGLVLPPIRYRRWRYALRPGDLWLRRGILFVTVSVIPYRRLQFVDTRQGPLARLLGLSELVVHTAAPGTSGTVPGLDQAEAEDLRERLAALEPDADASV